MNKGPDWNPARFIGGPSYVSMKIYCNVFLENPTSRNKGLYPEPAMNSSPTILSQAFVLNVLTF